MYLRYLATLTEFNHQLRSGLVVELLYHPAGTGSGEWIVNDIIDMRTLQAEPADTIYLSGRLHGDVRIGANARDMAVDGVPLSSLLTH